MAERQLNDGADGAPGWDDVQWHDNNAARVLVRKGFPQGTLNIVHVRKCTYVSEAELSALQVFHNSVTLQCCNLY
jgi:hypothetical protein